MFFEHLQGWWRHHLPGQPGPVSDHSFSKEIFPNIQSKPPLVQLEAIASHPIACYLGEEANTCLTTTSFHIVVEHSTVRKSQSSVARIVLMPPLFVWVLSWRFQFFQSLTIFFSLRPLPHLVQGVETGELVMSWWWFHLKCDPQALFTVQDSSPAMTTEWLISSWASLWLSLPWFLGTSEILTSLFSQHPCWDAVIDKTRKIVVKSLETKCKKLEFDIGRASGWTQRKER